MKLVFLIRSLEYGGAERQLVALAKGLRGLDDEISCVVFYPGGALESELRGAGIAVHSLDKAGRWDVVAFSRRLAALIRRTRPDVVHSYLVSANLAVAMLRPWFPHLAIAWGVRASNMDLRRYDWLARLSFRLSRWLSRIPDLIIANSQAGREFHCRQGFPNDRTICIDNGIDLDRFCPDAAARVRLRRQWAIADHEKLIGMVARLDPMKGHATFLQAAAALARTRPEVRFVCVGDGQARFSGRVRQQASDLGLNERVRWVAAERAVNDVYNALDLLTMASNYGEGFPNVVGEAMACGTPCVVTDVGDAARVVGAGGWVVPPGDPEALAAAWDGALQARDEPADGERLRAHIARHFGVDALVRKTHQALSALARGRT